MNYCSRTRLTYVQTEYIRVLQSLVNKVLQLHTCFGFITSVHRKWNLLQVKILFWFQVVVRLRQTNRSQTGVCADCKEKQHKAGGINMERSWETKFNKFREKGLFNIWFVRSGNLIHFWTTIILWKELIFFGGISLIGMLRPSSKNRQPFSGHNNRCFNLFFS